MTTRQKQLLLEYLGYPVGVIDGVDGVKTKAAYSAFCADYGADVSLTDAVSGAAKKLETPSIPPSNRIPDLSAYLQSDGFYHIPKGANIRVSEHFTSGEFDCQCRRSSCAETVIHPLLVDACEDMRGDVNRPVIVSSGYRCPPHNLDPDVGGAVGSLHTFGLAADLRCSGVSPVRMAQLAEARANYGEVGIYGDFVHIGAFRPDGRHTRWNKTI